MSKKYQISSFFAFILPSIDIINLALGIMLLHRHMHMFLFSVVTSAVCPKRESLVDTVQYDEPFYMCSKADISSFLPHGTKNKNRKK